MQVDGVSEPLDHIVLIGEMGTGKTTLGNLLADALDRPFLDSDEVIMETTGWSAAEIAGRDGIEALHESELGAFVTMTSARMPCVIAPASSVIDSAPGRALLRRCVTVWLVAPDRVLAERQRDDGHRRPVTPEERAALRSRRDPHLEVICDEKADTSQAAPEELVGELLSRLGEAGEVDSP